ncbi:MAG TPA: DUF4337 domain-containing protein [Bacteroidia bacterium]|jgi:hypothetical protein|nr:DUF4337 domain-containing protein [Bacteroidia bacterium]
MEEPEVPTEHLHESIEEKVEELGKEAGKKGWSILVAVSTAIMAVLAAVSSLQAGHHSNEAMIAQIKASDQWAFYQAKGIKAAITENMLLNKPADSAKLNDKLAKYKSDQDEISKEAKEDESESAKDLNIYKILAEAVTFFQISIAISAISMLTQKKFLWYIALALTLFGAFHFIMGNM